MGCETGCKSVADVIEDRRIALSRLIYDRTGGVIRHGLLKGFRIGWHSTWGFGTRAAMILGLYEIELQAEIAGIPARFDSLINLGASDGYYGVGLVATGRFARSVCYEIHPYNRGILEMVVQDSGVRDKVCTVGEATRSFPEEAEAFGLDLGRTVVICDIEGGEFDLFDDAVLAKLSRSVLLIELHEHLFQDGARRLDDLVARARRHFRVRVVPQAGRNPFAVPELKDLPETDQWLICSEGRVFPQSWLRLDPRDPQGADAP